MSECDQHEEAWAKIHDLLAAGHWARAREIFDQATAYIEPIEVCSALRWTMETFESTLAGKVVVNADEVISNAKRVLAKWEIK